MRWFLLALMLVVVPGSLGCSSSAYHRAQQRLPPNPADQLAMRVEEARRAETTADAANAKLDARLAGGLSGTASSGDIARPAAAAHELNRRIAAARDAAARFNPRADLVAEIKRLDQRGRSLLKRAKSLR
jgi:hypothetical protein